MLVHRITKDNLAKILFYFEVKGLDEYPSNEESRKAFKFPRKLDKRLQEFITPERTSAE